MLLLRAYMVHPSSWSDIVNDVKANIGQLNDRTRELYRLATNRQLRDRLSSKLNQLMTRPRESIEYEDLGQILLVFFVINN